MLIRIIFLFIVVVLVMWLLKRLFNDKGAPGDAADSSPVKPENMLQCKYCGTHVPESLIVRRDQNPYCCEEHADNDQ